MIVWLRVDYNSNLNKVEIKNTQKIYKEVRLKQILDEKINEQSYTDSCIMNNEIGLKDRVYIQIKKKS